MERLHLRRRLGGHRLLGRGLALSQGDRRLRDRRRHRLLAADPRIAHAQRLPVAFLAFTGEETSCSQLRGSVSAMHLDTGLFVNFGASATGDGLVEGTTRYRDTGVDDRELFYSGQAGIERPFLALGKTTIYADYYTITAELRRRCWSAPGTRSTRPALVNGRFGGPTSTFGVAASPRASIAPP